MGLWKSTKNIASKVFDVRVDKWMSLNYIQEVSGQTRSILKDLVVPKKATRTETYEQALERLHLTENDITQRKIEFTRLVYLFLGLSLLIICYAIYMIVKGYPLVGLISFCLSLYTLSQAFHFHFWLFQMKNKKLGCTPKEWFNSKIDKPADPTDPKSPPK